MLAIPRLLHFLCCLLFVCPYAFSVERVMPSAQRSPEQFEQALQVVRLYFTTQFPEHSIIFSDQDFTDEQLKALDTATQLLFDASLALRATPYTDDRPAFDTDMMDNFADLVAQCMGAKVFPHRDAIIDQIKILATRLEEYNNSRDRYQAFRFIVDGQLNIADERGRRRFPAAMTAGDDIIAEQALAFPDEAITVAPNSAAATAPDERYRCDYCAPAITDHDVATKNCPICLEPLSNQPITFIDCTINIIDTAPVHRLPSEHRFHHPHHTDCLATWINREHTAQRLPRCAICNESIITSRLPDSIKSLLNTDLYTPMLFGGIQHNRLDIVQHALSNGASLTVIESTTENTVFHYAAMLNTIDIITLLYNALSPDTRITIFDTQNKKGQTPLHYAAYSGRLETIKWLVQSASADITQQDTLDRTPLHFAADKGHLEAVKWLVQSASADITQQDSDGMNPLHRAAWNGHLETVKWLVEYAHADITEQQAQGLTPLQIAAYNGHRETVKWLVQSRGADITQQNSEGNTPLQLAAYNGHLETVQWLVEYAHGDITEQDSEGSNPLHNAAWNGHLETVKWLVQSRGADITQQNSEGNTPLHLAAWNGHLETAKWLVEYAHADITQQNSQGSTPLHCAAWNGHLETVQWLVKDAHANIRCPTEKGDTAETLARLNKHSAVAEWLKNIE